jgi:hypothetical protein
MDLSDVTSQINALNDNDFRIIVDACLLFSYSTNKLEKLEYLNESLVQFANSKDVAKWLIKQITPLLGLESQKLAKEIRIFGLNDDKTQILLESVIIIYVCC